jgi:alpha-galactosidase/6-phospho-beta-glucosidase family protein
VSGKVVSLKIAYIGGGSRNWARTLMCDLACCADLSGEIRLFDIDFESAKLNEQLGNWLQVQPGVVSNWHYKAVKNLEQALKGADLVFIAIQPGSLDEMEHEIAVAEKYGMFYPVGDTTGIPGLMRSLRSAITFAGFAHAIAEHCPHAWVINYTNPMTVCTRSLTKAETGLHVFGCCHEVFTTQEILAELAQETLGLQETPAREEITINVFGINHFTWIDRATFREHDLLAILREYIQKPGTLRPYTREEVESKNDWFFDSCQIKFTLFQHFGILAAAGDRHLSEFVPGFTRSTEELFRWGIIRTPVSWRKGNYEISSQLARDYIEGRIEFDLHASQEEAIRQIKALVGLGDFVTNVNTPNIGQISNLPLEVVVETNARFSLDQVQPLAAGSLPSGVQALVSRHVTNQEMIIEAAFTRNRDKAFQAVFNDPTNRASIDQTWAMFNEIGLPDNW